MEISKVPSAVVDIVIIDLKTSASVTFANKFLGPAMAINNK